MDIRPSSTLQYKVGWSLLGFGFISFRYTPNNMLIKNCCRVLVHYPNLF